MLYPLSYEGIIPVAGIEPATTRVRGELTVVFTTGQSSHSPYLLFPLRNALTNPSDLFVIALPFVNSDTVCSPCQLDTPSLNTIPLRLRLLITPYCNKLVANEIPLPIDQLATPRIVDSELVNLLLNESPFLPLPCAKPRRKTQNPASRVYIEPSNFISSWIRVHLVICANRALGFYHPFQMVENVASGYLAHIESLVQFTEYLVPRASHVAVQESFERTKHIAESFVVVTILSPASGRNEFRLIVIIGVGNEGKPLAPLTTLPSAAVALAFHNDFVHIRTHSLSVLSKVSRSTPVSISITRRGTDEKRDSGRDISR